MNLAENLTDTTRAHAGRVAVLNVAVAAGACLTLLPRFDAGHALRIIAGHGVTVFEGATGKIQKRDIVIPADLAAPNSAGPSAAAP